jgi:alkylation response protein AidB-like acyl-CoA dehydrogenase
MKRTLFDEDHVLFREAVRGFIEQEVVPHFEQWESDGLVDKNLFLAAGRQGLLGMDVPEEYGGGGVADFRFNAIIGEEFQLAGVGPAGLGVTLHNDICLPYFVHIADDEQKQRWLPGLVSGELVSAIAMTEPGTGSDLAGIQTTAIRHGDIYLVNGSKTFITNGINSDLVIAVVKTDPSQRHSGMSLLVVEDGMPGFTRGNNLDKLGMHAQDTAELFFTDVEVPVANLLGEEGQGFNYLVHNLPQERISIAVAAVAAAEAAFSWTLEYVKERHAFGQPIGSFQVSKHKLAEMRTEVDIGWTFLDSQIAALNEGTLSAEDAAKAKWWCTEMQNRTVDTGVQLHGGYGYMVEYPIARAFVDARAQTIYGGTTEIMKEIIGRSLGL